MKRGGSFLLTNFRASGSEIVCIKKSSEGVYLQITTHIPSLLITDSEN